MAGKKLTSSPRLNYLLYKMGIEDSFDVLEHLPRRYDSFIYNEQKSLYRLKDKERIVIYGKLITPPKLLRFARLSNVTFYFRDEWGGDYKVVAWNRSYLLKMLNMSDSYSLSASYDHKRHELSLLNIKKGRIDKEHSLIPIYSLPQDYPNHLFINLVNKSLKETEGKIDTIVPRIFIEKYRLLQKEEAYRKIHHPIELSDIKEASRTLKYEEALRFSLRNQIIRKQNKALKRKHKGKFDPIEVEAFVDSLPYSLTASQRKALLEAYKDMNDDSLMYRLLQGDVGSGKTLVAAILAYANKCRGMQTAFLAPTETLARQHFQTLSKIYEGSGMRIALLTGSIDHSSRKDVLNRLDNGDIDILVGTHALFSKDVEYKNLGLAIIDEQHKFGVNQRNLLALKGENADVYLMSATPIPRSLALSIYGDLDVSTLSEFPGGDRHVSTRIVSSSFPRIKSRIEKSLSEDKRVYVVAPRIEEKEDDELSSVKSIYEEYKRYFKEKCILLHGRMDDQEKIAAIESFIDGTTPILVATSLIEVGIDVKNADLMIIYEANSFSLSSLHQLRGRVGRDLLPADCYLVYEGEDDEDREKLEILSSTNDGFRIAEEDLARRGPGEMAGTKQSGLPDFALLNLVSDFRILECARDDAYAIISDPDNPEFSKIVDISKSETAQIILA